MFAQQSTTHLTMKKSEENVCFLKKNLDKCKSKKSNKIDEKYETAIEWEKERARHPHNVLGDKTPAHETDKTTTTKI